MTDLIRLHVYCTSNSLYWNDHFDFITYVKFLFFFSIQSLVLMWWWKSNFLRFFAIYIYFIYVAANTNWSVKFFVKYSLSQLCKFAGINLGSWDSYSCTCSRSKLFTLSNYTYQNCFLLNYYWSSFKEFRIWWTDLWAFGRNQLKIIKAYKFQSEFIRKMYIFWEEQPSLSIQLIEWWSA